MSERQRLKKLIYKGRQEGKDISQLEEKLENMEYTPQQRLNQKYSESSECLRYLKRDNITPQQRAQLQEEVKKLDFEILELQKTVGGRSYYIPYSVKKQIDMRSMFAGDFVQDELSVCNPKQVKILENNENTRYVILEVDEKIRRVNLETKSAFVSKNYYWFRDKKVTHNYKNCVKFKR